MNRCDETVAGRSSDKYCELPDMSHEANTAGGSRAKATSAYNDQDQLGSYALLCGGVMRPGADPV